ncbi:hypothetical protein [Flagellimonas allohymeniacidonis]|uniref:Uncharacterized protein n=1 Tax=Flagellimonas allohymeniacidonis TaxID=2517819 RepID=A0A4Q8QCC1_9FLAO|nr:hypothetical protein [Allomuricauda hymeniacidonis]TAI47314.1 hypothetical protein EW142_11580 [Allomuricauda hymeniacidonis]
MSKLVVSAEASPLFGNFLMVVSVSDEETGKPVKNLTKTNFGIYHMASLNHANKHQREIKKVTEGPSGFYIIQLKKWEYQPDLPPGHYVFAVKAVVHKLIPKITEQGSATATKLKNKKSGFKAKAVKWGQTVATGDLPPYGIWIK